MLYDKDMEDKKSSVLPEYKAYVQNPKAKLNSIERQALKESTGSKYLLYGIANSLVLWAMIYANRSNLQKLYSRRQIIGMTTAIGFLPILYQLRADVLYQDALFLTRLRALKNVEGRDSGK